MMLLEWEVNKFGYTGKLGCPSCIVLFTAVYNPTLPVSVTITSSSTPVAGGSLILTCNHGSTAMNPTYQWFDESGGAVGTQATLTLSPLLESNTGEYSCLVTDQARSVVGCGVERVTVQGMDSCFFPT